MEWILLLPLIKLRFVLLSAPLALLAVWKRRRVGRVAWLALPALAAVVALILVSNALWFGHALKYHRLTQLAAYTDSVSAYLLGLSGLYLDCAFGLVAAAPIWLLLAPSLLRPELRSRRVWAHAALVFGPYLLAVAPRGEWYGAWSPPFRYGVVALPLLCLALAPSLELRRRGTLGAAVRILAWVTAAVTVVWIVLPEWTYNLAHGRSHLLDALGARLGVDLARLFPSSIRPRAATWIWPVALALLSALPWVRRRARRSVGAATAVAGCLALAVAGLAAAAWLPTRIVEAEDAWVVHSRGSIYPERWVIGRRRFRGGWSLPPGSHLEARLAPGGDTVSFVLEVRKLRPVATSGSLVVQLDGEVLDRVALTDAADWQRVPLGPYRRSRRGPAVLRLASEGAPGRQSGALVDRIRVDWD